MIIYLNLTYFQSMNLTMIKALQGLVEGANEECLLHQLDLAKNIRQLDRIKMDEETSEENISSEDSLIDAEKIDINEREIKKIYVSLTKLLLIE